MDVVEGVGGSRRAVEGSGGAVEEEGELAVDVGGGGAHGSDVVGPVVGRGRRGVGGRGRGDRAEEGDAVAVRVEEDAVLVRVEGN